MDLSALMGTLLSGASVQGMSQKTGASQNEVASVLSAALPQLLSGANQQSLNANTAESFAQALASHAKSDTTDLSAFLGGVDMDDGAKIVAHLLGAGNTETEKKKVAKASGVSSAKTGLILAAAAPLLMSLIGKQTASAQQKNTAVSTSSLMGSLLGNADVGSLAAALLGASGNSKSKKDDGLDLGDVANLLGKLLK